MSRNFAVLGKAAATPAGTRHPSEATLDPRAGANAAEFGELVRRLLPGAEVVAVISSGPADDATAICEGIAAEFSRAGKRVVLVSVDKLLPMDIVTLPDENAFMPGPSRNIWLWPSPVGQQIEFFKPRAQLGAENWLDLLRRNFDFVVLDCPSPQTAPLSAAIAARADAAVLAVEAGRTRKDEIVRAQRSLQLSGVKLVGCLLVTG